MKVSSTAYWVRRFDEYIKEQEKLESGKYKRKYNAVDGQEYSKVLSPNFPIRYCPICKRYFDSSAPVRLKNGAVMILNKDDRYYIKWHGFKEKKQVCKECENA